MLLAILSRWALLALAWMAIGNAEEQDNPGVLEFVEPSCDKAHFIETFQEETVLADGTWMKSTHEKYIKQNVTVSRSEKLSGTFKDDKALVLGSPAMHYGVSRKLDQPFSMKGRKDMVFQYEVRLEQGLNCGGAYVKLLRDDVGVNSLDDKTRYTIMFGPDKCGPDSKVHFILQHQNPVSGEWEEKHLANPPQAKSDKKTHLYTLIVRHDNSFEILIDQVSSVTGNLLKELNPPINPPKEIDDPDDKKPEDWVDEMQIADPDAVKPDDWDEEAPEMIVNLNVKKPTGWLEDEPNYVDDPEAEIPKDWDYEEDGDWDPPQIANPKCEAVGCGEWTAPLIANPDYKGKWTAPMIDNPKYKGEWVPRKIENLQYFVDENPTEKIEFSAVAIEVWTMSGGISFDNFYLSHDIEAAAAFAAQSWKSKFDSEASEDEEENKEKLKRDGGMGSLAQMLMNDVVDSVKNQPWGLIGAGVAVLVVLLIVCCGPGGSSGDESMEKDKTSDNEDENKEAENDGGDVNQEDEKPKVRQRKRAPKAE